MATFPCHAASSRLASSRAGQFSLEPLPGPGSPGSTSSSGAAGAERYAKQLAGHWACKGSAAEEDGATVIHFDTGQVVRLMSDAGLLRVEASVPDDGDPERFALVVKDHLERFGQREELDVVWPFNHFASPHWFAADGGWLAEPALGRALRALLRVGHRPLRRPHGVCRDAERAQPAAVALLGRPAPVRS
ncbi:DUF2218 domain-containing protein [Humibacillus xanthopallidus]|uniref:DUF2218 domain-containing protein n=1 Tax=Humibacillus xanthopallidus TaxID=412689 RepID=UPI001C8ADD4A|nr:DUF2218 domain-containing protein [Humibacillus xanthopallidus]